MLLLLALFMIIQDLNMIRLAMGLKITSAVRAYHAHPIVARLTILVLVGTIVSLLLPLGIVSVWAANLIGTPGSDTIVGSNSDDNILGMEGNDKITDGYGSDNVLAGSGDDKIKVVGTRDPRDSTDERGGQDGVYGDKGRDTIDNSGEYGFRLIYGGDDDDTITAGSGNYEGKIFGGSGNDQISAGGDVDFDVWGGSGNDEIDGASECAINRAFGESGNDRIISPTGFASGGAGNDFIQFLDCGGVAYGDNGDDGVFGGEWGIEAHGGTGDDELEGGEGENELFGDSGDDTLTGSSYYADFFSCGAGTDTITDFDAAEGDTKTTDCERF